MVFLRERRRKNNCFHKAVLQTANIPWSQALFHETLASASVMASATGFRKGLPGYVVPSAK